MADVCLPQLMELHRSHLPSPPRTRVPRASAKFATGRRGEPTRGASDEDGEVMAEPRIESRNFCPLPAGQGVREEPSLGLERTSQATDTHQKVRLRDRGQWTPPRHCADQGTVNTVWDQHNSRGMHTRPSKSSSDGCAVTGDIHGHMLVMSRGQSYPRGQSCPEVSHVHDFSTVAEAP